MMRNTGEWLKRWQQLADSGDADALIVVAWEYVKGELVEKDFNRATLLFRKAEQTKPQVARFNLAKAKIKIGDAIFSNEIQEDCETGFGPALYLMGAVEARGIFHPKNVEKAADYFLVAAQSGHLISEFLVWRLQSKSIFRWIVTLPHAIYLLLKTIMVKTLAPDDLSVLA